MNGVINVLKPPKMTSHDVVAIMRRLTGVKRIGHTGTLDPMVAGVLPVCIGRATKIADYLMNQGKGYTAEVTFGYETDTQDVWGEATRQSNVIPQREEIENFINQLKGELSQVPPAYSALKINGQKMVDRVRNGEIVDMESKRRTVQIYDSVYLNGQGTRHLFKIECSKGTYVRTICNELGIRLNSAAHMSFLVRHRSGPFHLEQAMTIEALREMSKEEIESHLISMPVALGYPIVEVPEALVQKVLNGVKIPLGQLEGTSTYGSIVTPDGQFLGIGCVEEESRNIFMHKLLHI